MTLTTLMGAALCATGVTGESELGFSNKHLSRAEQLEGLSLGDPNEVTMVKQLIPDTELIVRYGHRHRRWESSLTEYDDMRAIVNLSWDLGHARSEVRDTFIGVDPSQAPEDGLDSIEWEARVVDCLEQIERSRMPYGGGR